MTATTTFGLVTHGGVLDVDVHAGPALLAGIDRGPSLLAHQHVYGDLGTPPLQRLLELATAVGLRGRGGAAFPFAVKLEAAAKARGRPTVVVNLSEGEPASFKDTALAVVAPHLVLDGAVLTARALGARRVHLVVPGEHDVVGDALRTATAARGDRDRGTAFEFHVAAPAFVSGQARAVIELLSGRPNLPVTSWQPEAVKGLGGRPTLLSNAETFAQLARLAQGGAAEYRRHGTPQEAGTTLLTLDGDTARATVVEVAFGTPWTEVLGGRVRQPVLLGGYHGTWAAPGSLQGLTVSRDELTGHDLTLGAGVVLPTDGCPVRRAASLTRYLASQSAGRCGPCLNGLPALAQALGSAALGTAGTAEVERLSLLVRGRGACAHPDGTSRMVLSLVTSYADELGRHARGECGYEAPVPARKVG